MILGSIGLTQSAMGVSWEVQRFSIPQYFYNFLMVGTNIEKINELVRSLTGSNENFDVVVTSHQ